MSNEADVIAEPDRARNDSRDAEMEVCRLVACYQLASYDDRRVVWAVLNKYAPLIEPL